jgi:hypothetical protein
LAKVSESLAAPDPLVISSLALVGRTQMSQLASAGGAMGVLVQPDSSFEWEGAKQNGLSAVAKAATGQHVNGFRFFHLERER